MRKVRDQPRTTQEDQVNDLKGTGSTVLRLTLTLHCHGLESCSTCKVPLLQKDVYNPRKPSQGGGSWLSLQARTPGKGAETPGCSATTRKPESSGEDLHGGVGQNPCCSVCRPAQECNLKSCFQKVLNKWRSLLIFFFIATTACDQPEEEEPGCCGVYGSSCLWHK